jgi:hypothetical protein
MLGIENDITAIYLDIFMASRITEEEKRHAESTERSGRRGLVEDRMETIMERRSARDISFDEQRRNIANRPMPSNKGKKPLNFVDARKGKAIRQSLSK